MTLTGGNYPPLDIAVEAVRGYVVHAHVRIAQKECTQVHQMDHLVKSVLKGLSRTKCNNQTVLNVQQERMLH